ncbi:hypothetical protein SASPL_131049 [Salvia splendens]|uniref:AT-rich interactive domain-containing protein 2 n=1 Tax=Salvia splendens TaxID=180675 RepID=A0A8X8ZJZ4_SALSN|nr:AT-rich interactive domain-containing protein 2-like [Salvia splendens]KAG6408047.1 hypothetical protein SASPL_131049 [Salvia splendens]
MVKLRDDKDGNGGGNFGGDGNDIKTFRFAFDLNFQIEKYRFDSCKHRLRGLFDQVVVSFLRDKSAGKFHRPIPAFCGEGQPVDLFKLFWLVRKFGGYDAVSRNNLWGFISDECGLGRGVIASLKLIYMNYLSELDQWLQRVFSNRVLEDDHCGFIQKLDLLSRELEIRFKGMLPNKQEQEQLGEGATFVGEANDRSHIMIDDFASSAKIVNELNGVSRGQVHDDGDIIESAKKLIDDITNKVLNHKETTISVIANDYESSSALVNSGSCTSSKKVNKVNCRKPNGFEKIPDGEESFRAQLSIDDKITPKSDAGNVLASRKRKQESHSFSGMLEWLIHAAKHSGDPSVGSVPECSKWGDRNGEFWADALFVRDALLIKRHASKAAGEVLQKDQQKKPRMLPSMYEDEVIDHQTTEKLRYSRRIPVIKPPSCSCCPSSAAPHSHREADVARPKEPSEAAATVVKEQPLNMNDHKSCDVPAEREVSIGPRFQAQVPQWTGTASDSDSKWLGTRMWPPEDGKINISVKLDPIGKGRQHRCSCSFPESVECVRFHIAEKRLKLKQELGSLFYRWRFYLMGEEVSLSWSEQEEGIFKDNMKSYAAFSNKFWNNSWRFLPSKSREKLVSYYFNVYLVQRRSYQNRVSPRDIDSDDDEKVCGSIGGSFGHKALYIHRPSSVSCALNTESTEFV